MAEICVMGLGYVGLPTASLLATAGFDVLGVDVNPVVVESLNKGRTIFKEAGLSTMVAAACHSGNLVAALEPAPSDTFIICVPTPISDEKKADLSLVEQASRAIGPLLRHGNLVILESTSPIGTTRNVVGEVIREHGFEPGMDVHVCYCPERVLPGNTVAELVNNDRVIGGMSPDCAKRAVEIYQRFAQGELTLTNDLTAEMVKLAENTYRDVNIALANVFARVAEDAGIDVWEAISYANHHPRVDVLSPGPGVGGHCIPVDPWFLVESFPAHAELLAKARQINDGQGERMLERMMESGDLVSGDKVAILGAAYKADIDDPRESPAAHLSAAAKAKGLEVAVHDPLVEPGDWHGLMISNDLDDCLGGATAAVLVTNHKEYRSLSAKNFGDRMKGRLIYDSRKWLNHAALRRAGFKVFEVGRSLDQTQADVEVGMGTAGESNVDSGT